MAEVHQNTHRELQALATTDLVPLHSASHSPQFSSLSISLCLSILRYTLLREFNAGVVIGDQLLHMTQEGRLLITCCRSYHQASVCTEPQLTALCTDSPGGYASVHAL